VKDDRDFQRRFLPALQPPVSSAVKPREPRKFPVLLSQTPCLLRKSPGPDITVTPDPLLHVFGNFDSDVTVRNFFKCPGLFLMLIESIDPHRCAAPCGRPAARGRRLRSGGRHPRHVRPPAGAVTVPLGAGALHGIH